LYVSKLLYYTSCWDHPQLKEKGNQQNNLHLHSSHSTLHTPNSIPHCTSTALPLYHSTTQLHCTIPHQTFHVAPPSPLLFCTRGTNLIAPQASNQRIKQIKQTNPTAATVCYQFQYANQHAIYCNRKTSSCLLVLFLLLLLFLACKPAFAQVACLFSILVALVASSLCSCFFSFSCVYFCSSCCEKNT